MDDADNSQNRKKRMSANFGEELIAMLPRLRRFAISLTGSRDQADDLVQTACAKALSAKESYAEGTRFDVWMFRILRNSWIDSKRKQKVEGPPADIADHEEAVTSDGETAAISRLTLNAVLEAMRKLPEEQREVLVLVCVEEFSYGEAANLLGIPIGTVMSRLARAREKISQIAGIGSKPQR
jgi:RNA polymerase sigma-70 factor (ECF subfamily)